ncbi:hypothetical protein [Rhodococcus sp. ARC_M5]|uniref:hypothetical protein n=1 Tax=Rhodococcus sp. ARC_M5 TaxID=2928851 RepID=UPI001FB32A7B|nr:hypothetical protein [Rhodococcus sp. ARC_M5]MCJ0895378.1 hypothetical protein [Rhodococcus sp. ARC_M5]
MNEETGGIGWWSVYPLWPTQRAELSHYFVSIVGAVSTNLDESAAHLHHYRDRVGAENQHLTHRHQAAGGRVPDLRHRTELERLRLVMVRAEQAAFFRSIGSVLDTLAGVVIATGALKMDLLKADLGQLRVGSDSPLYPRIPGQAGGSLRRALDRDGTAGGAAQESFMQSIRAAVTHAGPTGWLQWTLGTRNHFIHRSRWMDLLVRDWPNRRKLPVWVRPLPRSPSAGEGSSLNNAETVSDSYLTEDATTTMEGVLLSVDAVAKAVFECSSSLWALRRSDPFLLFQPGTQWQGQEYATQFAGYRPDTALAAFQAADAVVLNPVDSARLAALARSKERRL